MELNERYAQQTGKYKFLTESPYFLKIDEDEEYEERLIYSFSDPRDNEIFEAAIYIPIAEGKQYDWEFSRYSRIDDMAVRTKEARSLPETEDWFKELAKPIDNLVRLKKLMK